MPSTPTPTRGTHPRRAFSLVELLAVVVVLAILAGVVLPGLGAVSGLRRQAAADEVRRLLTLARASARGVPAGVAIAPATGDVTLVSSGPAGVAALVDALGEPRRAVNLGRDFGGARFGAIVDGGDDAIDPAVFWFGFDGTPERRDASGAYVGPFTRDARIEIVDVGPVVVRRATGVIE